MSPISVVVADHHPIVVRGLCDVFSQNGLNVVAACVDGIQAIKALRELRPDVAVLDMYMPGADGLQVLATANSDNLNTRILFLSAAVSSRVVMTAMAEGAYAILFKDSNPDEIVSCVRDAADGKKRLPFEIFERVREKESEIAQNLTARKLTKREWKVAALAAQGFSNKEIARELLISEGTAKIHLHHVFKKLQVTTRVALAHVKLHSQSLSH